MRGSQEIRPSRQSGIGATSRQQPVGSWWRRLWTEIVRNGVVGVPGSYRVGLIGSND